MGHFGIIFNSNRELLRNYHAEKRFELHHYTCAGCYCSLVSLRNFEIHQTFEKFISKTVDNRGQDDGDAGAANTLQRQNSKGEAKEGDTGALQATPIEKLIHTKWAESKITFLHQIDNSKLSA
jgi:ubiquitin carboxyl-terminal hydrolase MINDY-3/4